MPLVCRVNDEVNRLLGQTGQYQSGSTIPVRDVFPGGQERRAHFGEAAQGLHGLLEAPHHAQRGVRIAELPADMIADLAYPPAPAEICAAQP